MISGVSTRSINQALQRSIQIVQREMLAKQKEVQTGTLADVSESLGEKAAAPISFLRDVSRLSSILETNKTATTRLQATQEALDAIRAANGSALSALTAGNQTEAGRRLAAQSARSGIEAMTAVLNTSINGQYIFSGLNTDTAPIDASNGIPAGTQMDAAFLANFGFAKTDPQAALITTADFQTFITNDIEPLFASAGWDTSVSSASDAVIRSRISLTQVSDTSVSANENGIRTAVFASALAANFLDTPLNNSVADHIVKTSVSMSATAAGELASIQARAGFTQEKLSEADARISAQRDLFMGAADDLTSVDPYEAATRLNTLLTQLEASYALTQKIRNMNIMRYLG